MTKILLLGLGRWGLNHFRNLHNLPVELFVAEIGDKQLEPARKLGLPAERLTTNYKDFISKVDGVVVVTPAQTHFPLCQEFLEAGKDVFVEKPLTLLDGESKALAELAARKGRILQVGHILRFDPATIWLRDAIQNGEFGKVNMIRGHFGGFKRPRNDSGVMFADGIHFVDLFNFILGALPKSVLAIHHDFMNRGLDDVSFVSLEYETPRGKTWATVENDYFIPGKFREIIVCGDQLSAACDYNVAQYKIKTYANRHERAGNDFKATEGIVQTPLVREWATPVYHMYVVRAEKRDDLQKFLKEKNIETGIHYPKPNHLQPAVIGLFPYIPKLSNTEKAVKEILSLPIHGEMALDAADKVCDAVAEFYGKK